MYRIQTEPRYWWPVKIRQPDPAKPGAMLVHEFEAEFKWLTQQDYDAWLANVGQRTDAEVMPEVCTGFRKVRNEDGSELANTPDNLALLLASDKAVGHAVAAAFFESRAKAAEKN
jgi:hypothetical protein